MERRQHQESRTFIPFKSVFNTGDSTVHTNGECPHRELGKELAQANGWGQDSHGGRPGFAKKFPSPDGEVDSKPASSQGPALLLDVGTKAQRAPMSSNRLCDCGLFLVQVQW